MQSPVFWALAVLILAIFGGVEGEVVSLDCDSTFSSLGLKAGESVEARCPFGEDVCPFEGVTGCNSYTASSRVCAAFLFRFGGSQFAALGRNFTITATAPSSSFPQCTSGGLTSSRSIGTPSLAHEVSDVFGLTVLSSCEVEAGEFGLGSVGVAVDVGCPLGCSGVGAVEAAGECPSGQYGVNGTALCSIGAHALGSGNGGGALSFAGASPGCANVTRSFAVLPAPQTFTVAQDGASSSTTHVVASIRSVAGAVGYLVTGEPLCFQDSFSESFADSLWEWDAANCPLGSESQCGFRFFAGESKVEFYTQHANSVINQMSPLAAGAYRSSAAVLWRPEVVDPRVDWSAEWFSDVVSGEGFIRENSHQGLLVWDDTMQDAFMWCGASTWSGRSDQLLRECKRRGSYSPIAGGPTRSDGKSWLRLDWVASSNAFEFWYKDAGATTTTPWTLMRTMHYEDLNTGKRTPGPLRIGFFMHTWSGGTFRHQVSDFKFKVGDGCAGVTISHTVPADDSKSAIGVLLEAPQLTPYTYAVRTLGPKGPGLASAERTAGVAPMTFPDDTLPLDASARSFYRLRDHYDFSQFRSGRFGGDRGKARYLDNRISWGLAPWTQSVASRRPALVSGAQGDRSAVQLDSSTFLQVGDGGWDSRVTGSGQETWLIVMRIDKSEDKWRWILSHGNGGARDEAASVLMGPSYGIAARVAAKQAPNMGSRINNAAHASINQANQDAMVMLRYHPSFYEFGYHHRGVRVIVNHRWGNRDGTVGAQDRRWFALFSTKCNGFPSSSCAFAPGEPFHNTQPSYTGGWKLGANLNGDADSGATGEVYEILRFKDGDRIGGTELSAVHSYLEEKYYLRCNATTAGITTSKAQSGTQCASSSMDASCRLECADSGHKAIMGVGGAGLTSSLDTLDCVRGGMDKAALFCGETCPNFIRADNVERCMQDLVYEDFGRGAAIRGSSISATGDGATRFEGYHVHPHVPDRYRPVVARIVPNPVTSSPSHVMMLNAIPHVNAGNPNNPVILRAWNIRSAQTRVQSSKPVEIGVRVAVRGGKAGLVWSMLDEENYMRATVDFGAEDVATHKIESVIDGVVTTIASTTTTSGQLQAVQSRAADGRPKPQDWITSPLERFVKLTVTVTGDLFVLAVDGFELLRGSGAVLPKGDFGILAMGGTSYVRDWWVGVECPVNGVITDAVENQRARYECRVGYTLVGAFPVCRDGAWVHEDTSCRADPPVFLNTTRYISEAAPSGTNVGAPLVADAQVPVTFRLSRSEPWRNPGGVFHIDACTGQITIRGAGVDFESQSTYELMVEAIPDSEESSLAVGYVTVHVLDANDAPIVDPGLQVTFYENATVGDCATGTLSATDPENSPLRWNVTFGDPFGIFTITPLSPLTARICVAKPDPMAYGIPGSGLLNHEATPAFFLYIRAYDALEHDVFGDGVVRVNVLNSPEPPRLLAGQVLVIDEARATGVHGPAPLDLKPLLEGIDEDAQNDASNTSASLRFELKGVYGGSWESGVELGALPRIDKSSWPFSVDENEGEVWLDELLTIETNDNRSIDGLFTRAAFQLEIKTTDVDGEYSFSNVSVLVSANISSIGGAIVRDVQTPSGGLTTAGNETIVIKGDQLDAAGTSASATLHYGPYSTSACKIVMLQTQLEVTPEVHCTSVPGVGENLAVSLQIAGRYVTMGVPAKISYRAPLVEGVQGTPAGSVGESGPDVNALNTAGGEIIYLQGSDFGAEPTRVVVTYGPANPNYDASADPEAPGVDPSTLEPFLWEKYAATVMSAKHTELAVRTAEGVGMDLRFQVTVAKVVGSSGGQVASITYGPPRALSIAPASSSAARDAEDFSTYGETAAVVVTGENFGPFPGGTDSVAITMRFVDATHTELSMACIKRDVLKAHTEVVCDLEAGVGSYLPVQMALDGRWGEEGPGTIGYRAPELTAVSGKGAVGANTEGGQELVFTGDFFGPRAGGVTWVRVGADEDDAWWGPLIESSGGGGVNGSASPVVPPSDAATPRFEALQCRVESQTQINCLTSPGAGKGYSSAVRVGGKRSSVFSDSLLSYGPPALSSFSGMWKDAPTPGGDLIKLRGRNFGPENLYVYNQSVWVEYVLERPELAQSRPASSIVYMRPILCWLSIEHVEMTCSLAPGAGQGLSWSVQVLGQNSTDPSTSYIEPSIDSVVDDDTGAAVDSATTDGGVVMRLNGANFGPPDRAHVLLDWVRFGSPDAIASGESIPGKTYLYYAVNVSVVSHTEIHAIMPPGVGRNLQVQVSIAGQLSSPNSAAVVSYARPRVLSVTPMVVSTDANAHLYDVDGSLLPTEDEDVIASESTEVLVRVRGTDFGLSVVGSMPGVLLGNPAPDYSLRAQMLLPAIPPRTLPNGRDEIFFRPPPGEGANRAIRVGIFPPSLSPNKLDAAARVAALSDPVVDGNSAVLSYTAPIIEYVAATPPTSAAEVAFVSNASSMGCPQPSKANDWCGWRLVQLHGRSFGAVPRPALVGVDGVSVAGSLAWRFALFPEIPYVAEWVNYHWSHTDIFAFLRWDPSRAQDVGYEVRVQVGSYAFDGTPQAQTSSWSLVASIQPTIGALEGAATPFPTSGGSSSRLLRVPATGLLPGNPTRIVVGNSTCQAYNEPTKSYFNDVQLGANITSDSSIITCIVPPGQGADVPVSVMVNDGVDWVRSVSRSSDVIHYQPPSLTRAAIANSAGAFVDWHTETTDVFEVPTVNGDRRMRIEGDNFGILSNCGSLEPDSGLLRSHTFLEFELPRGHGKGLQIRIDVGGQQPTNPLRAAFVLDYTRPVITSIVALANPTAGIPTEGNAAVRILGSNFGVRDGYGGFDGLPWSATNDITTNGNSTLIFADRRVWVGLAGGGGTCLSPGGSWSPCGSLSFVNSNELQCIAPPGLGNLDVCVSIGNRAPILFSNALQYARPVIDRVWLAPMQALSMSEAGGFLSAEEVRAENIRRAQMTPLHPSISAGEVIEVNTTGKSILVIEGANFGTASLAGELVKPAGVTFPPLVDSASSDPGMGGAERATPLPFCVFLSWTFRSFPEDAALCDDVESFHGEGEVPAKNILTHSHRRVEVIVPPGLGARTLRLVAAGSSLANDPSVTGSAPDVIKSNGGLVGLVTVRYAAPVLVDRPRPGHGPTSGGTRVRLLGYNFGPSIRDTSTNPVGAAFRSGRVSLNSAPTIPTALLLVDWHSACATRSYTPDGAVPTALRTCAYDIRSLTHDSIDVLSAPGIGVNRAIRVSVLDGPFRYESGAVRWNYDPPRIDVVTPNPMLLGGVLETDGRGAAALDGPQRFEVYGANFGDDSLADVQNWTVAERQVNMSVGEVVCVRNSIERSAQGRVPVLRCDIPRQPVGFKDVTIFVAGQNGTLPSSDSQALLVACDDDFYALEDGQECRPCPLGAHCFGWQRETDDKVLRDRLRVIRENGGDERFAEHHLTRPDPMFGWYDMNGTAGSACSEAFRDGEKDRDVCIVPCEPEWACDGSNYCGVGYVSKAPNFRCSSCADGYYRRAGICEKCPQAAWVLIIFLLCALGLGCYAAYVLNRKQISIALLSIGVDFFQILAVFSSARLSWPPLVQELFHILSAFNLNIEITAPECTFPDVTYSQKWWAMMVLPVAGMAVLSIGFGCYVLYQRSCKGRNRSESLQQLPQLVSMTLVGLYFIYLQVTKVAFEVLTCVPTSPPDGRVYLIAEFEPCDKPGGIHQTLLGPALVFIAIYTLGYPAILAWNLYTHKQDIVTDQLLRALGTGNTPSTNTAQGLWTRMAFSRTYYAFRPDFFYWSLVLLARKLGIALVSLALATTPSIMLAAMVGVLFISYTVHNRWLPYMTPRNAPAVLAAHREAAEKDATSLHGRARAVIDEMRRKVGSKRTRITNIQAIDSMTTSRSPLVRFGGAVLGSALLDFNQVEFVLLFCSILVLLAGLCFESESLNDVYYRTTRDALTICTVILIISAVLYYFVALGIELHALLQNAAAVREARMGRKGKKGGRKGIVSTGAAEEDEVETDLAEVNNPMLLRRGKDEEEAAGGSSAAVADAILELDTIPDRATWVVFQDAYRELREEMEKVRSEGRRQRSGSASTTGSGGHASSTGGSTTLSAYKFGTGSVDTGAGDPTTTTGKLMFSPLARARSKRSRSRRSLSSSSSSSSRSRPKSKK